MPLLAFTVAVAYLPTSLFPSGAELGRWAALAVGATVLLWSNQLRPLRGFGGRAGLLFLLWCVVGIAWSLDPLTSLGALLRVGALATAALAVSSLERGLLWFAAGVAVSSLVCLWQVWSGAGLEFATGLFAGKNQAVEVAVPLAVWGLLSKHWWVPLMLAPLIMFSGSKEVIAMLLAAGFMVVTIKTAETSWRPREITAGFLMCLIGLALMFAVAVHTNASATLGERATMWHDAWAAWLIHPFGWGFGTFPWLFPTYEYAHNEFVNTLVEVGPLGLALLVVLLGAALFAPGRLPERAALAALCASACLWWPFHAPASALLAALLIGSLLRRDGREPAGGVAERDCTARPWRAATGALRGTIGGYGMVPTRFSFAPFARAISAGVQRAGALAGAALTALIFVTPGHAQPAPSSPPGFSVLASVSATLAVTSVTGRIQLPNSTTVYPLVSIYNDGSTEAFISIGGSTVTAAACAGTTGTCNSVSLPMGATLNTFVGGGYVAAITSTSTTTLRLTQWTGHP